MSKKTSIWSKEEIEIAKNKELTHNEVCEATGRSYNAVKIKRLELKVDQKRSNNLWTSKEIEILVKNRDKSSADISKMLDRTELAVSIKRQKLKLNRLSNKWEAEEIEYLVENYIEIPREEIAKYLGRTLTAVYSKISELGISSKPQGYWKKSEIKILKTNKGLGSKALSSLLPSKSISQIQYKIHHLRQIAKMEADKSGVEKNIAYSSSKTTQYAALLDALNIDESFVFPQVEYYSFLEATNLFPDKYFKTKREDENERRVWRIA